MIATVTRSCSGVVRGYVAILELSYGDYSPRVIARRSVAITSLKFAWFGFLNALSAGVEAIAEKKEVLLLKRV